MTSQVRNLWCRSQNKMGPSSKYVSSQHIVDLRQPQVAMKHHLRSVKNTCVAQSLYSEFRPLDLHNVTVVRTAYLANRSEKVKGNIPRISSYTWLFPKNTGWFVVLRSNP